MPGQTSFTYESDKQSQISFPVGGIGAGCIGLAGNGRLFEWEIFNRPSKGTYNGFSHFAVKCERDGKLLDARVLQSDLPAPFIGTLRKNLWEGYGWGPEWQTMAGFPHFRSNTFTGRFPVAELDFHDDTFPGHAKLKAFNPFLPMDSKNSSLPAAFYEITLENPNDFDADFSVALSVMNPHHSSKKLKQDGLQGLFFESRDDKDSLSYGDMTVLTDAQDLDLQERWYRGAWRDAITVYWRQFTQGRMPERDYADQNEQKCEMSTLCAHKLIPAGSSATFRFLISWSSPNMNCYWNNDRKDQGNWKNWYATEFPSSLESALYSFRNWDDFYQRTESFLEVLTGSSLPPAALESVVSNLAILKSPTILRLEDGTLYGFEGTSQDQGVCEGSCTHVWNYTYAFPFLFPDLERSMRRLDFAENIREDGAMRHRLVLPIVPGATKKDYHFQPCADGQFGGVIKAYRDWKISGDTEWLRSIWPEVKASLEYAWHPKNSNLWDPDKTGVLRGRQHHTLDMQLFGPNSWLGGFYLAALKAGAEMAASLGEEDNANEWQALFEAGKAWVDEHLFNGKYYHQEIDLADKELLAPFDGQKGFECTDARIYKSYWNEEAQEIKYQVGEGCEIQQVMAQWHANLCGLGEIFDKKQVKIALKSLFEHNFIEQMRTVANPWRNYCLNDESGLLIATWPEGTYYPTVPLPYETETQGGYEYQALIHMIQEGLEEEGQRGIRAIRERYDGEKRNPWNEIECGNNYARSMASYALLLTYSGFSYDLTQGFVGFAPVEYKDAPQEKSYFWSVGTAWGSYRLWSDHAEFRVKEGSITLKSFSPEAGAWVRFPSEELKAGDVLSFTKLQDSWKSTPARNS